MSERPQGIKRRTSGYPRRELRGRGKDDAAIKKALALVHVTAVGAAREIIDAGQFEIRRCPVFNTDLVYFFIMRPAYRLRNGDEKSDQINRFPFVFICAPDNLGSPFHVYPFDTGGAVSGVFGDRPDPYVFLEDYELEPSLSSAAAHIEWAFGSVDAYLKGDVREELMDQLKQWDDIGRGFLTIAGLASSRHNQPDIRSSAIEVAYRSNIPLKGKVKFAIIPDRFLEDDNGEKNTSFIKKLNELGIAWDIYKWQPNLQPDDFIAEISRITRLYFAKADIDQTL